MAFFSGRALLGEPIGGRSTHVPRVACVQNVVRCVEKNREPIAASRDRDDYRIDVRGFFGAFDIQARTGGEGFLPRVQRAFTHLAKLKYLISTKLEFRRPVMLSRAPCFRVTAREPRPRVSSFTK